LTGPKKADNTRGKILGRSRHRAFERRPAIEITATPCRHGPPLSRAIACEVVGFALRPDDQEHGVLCISGGTVRYDGGARLGDRLQIDTGLLDLGTGASRRPDPVRSP
jgi:hypothetical protein